MSQNPMSLPSWEPERHELYAAPTYYFELARREFFKALGGGLVVLFTIKDAPAMQESGGGRRGAGGESAPSQIGAWIHIGEDSKVTVYTGKVEIGQNIRTSLTQVVSEELHTPVSRIRLVMADTALTPFDGGTAGSMTTPMMASQLRRVAAAAREALLDLATERTRLQRDQLKVADGRIKGPSSETALEFGELTKGKKLMQLMGEEAPTTPAGKWTVAGTSVAKVDGRAF